MVPVKINKAVCQRRIWTEEERNVVRELFADNYTATICQILDRSYSSVCAQARLMGLKKSEAFIKAELQRQGARIKIAGVTFRYKKGRESENKGKAMPNHVYEKVKHTMFQKGQKPHNTKYDGYERTYTDGYVKIRVRSGKYVLKHRHLWEQANGKIPRGYLVVFKDNNPQNLVLENLELISREENMQRNTINRFPDELKSTIRLVKKIKRVIYEKQN